MTRMEYWGRRFSEFRKSKKMTLQDVADKIHFSKTQIFNFESGKIKNPSWAFIEAIEKAFGIKMTGL